MVSDDRDDSGSERGLSAIRDKRVNRSANPLAGVDRDIVARLKDIDDQCLERAKRLEKDILNLRQAFAKDQMETYFDHRQEKLGTYYKKDAHLKGTPQCKGFWVQALANHPDMDDYIREHDVRVLMCLKDITAEDKDENTFALRFWFGPNEYFENEEIILQIVCKGNLVNARTVAQKISCDTVKWKPGQDVTVVTPEKKKKTRKTRASSREPTGEHKPRASFFRRFLCSYEIGKPLPEQVSCIAGATEQDVEELMNEIMEVAFQIKHYIIPYAASWYTGEAELVTDFDFLDDEEDEEVAPDAE